MAHLLYEALKCEIAPEYVQRLLMAFPVTEQKEYASEKSQVDQSGLIDPLSDREIDVLQTNCQRADQSGNLEQAFPFSAYG